MEDERGATSAARRAMLQGVKFWGRACGLVRHSSAGRGASAAHRAWGGGLGRLVGGRAPHTGYGAAGWAVWSGALVGVRALSAALADGVRLRRAAVRSPYSRADGVEKCEC